MMVYDAKGPCRGISICAASAGHRIHLAATAPVLAPTTPLLWNNKSGGMPNRSTTHSDVSPRERLHRGMQPSLTTPNQLASTPSPQTLKTAWESTATYGLRWRSPCHFARTCTSRPRCDCFNFSFLPPARSGLGMLPQPYCAYCLCARTDCVSLRMGSQIDWMFPRRAVPRVSLRWSRVASSCPADSPKGQYEEAKASVCRQ